MIINHQKNIGLLLGLFLKLRLLICLARAGNSGQRKASVHNLACLKNRPTQCKFLLNRLQILDCCIAYIPCNIRIGTT